MASSRSPAAPPPRGGARRARGRRRAGTISGAQTSQHGTPGAPARVRSPKWRRIVVAPARVALDEGPDRAVLAPARALRLARRRAARRPRAAVERRHEAPAQRGPSATAPAHDARAREVPDDRAHLIASSPARRSRRQLALLDVERRVRTPRASRSATARERRLVDLGALDEEHVQALVARLGEQQRSGRRAVAAGAAGLLVVGLDRPRHGRVADGPHVGLVDAHPERVRRDDDARPRRP